MKPPPALVAGTAPEPETAPPIPGLPPLLRDLMAHCMEWGAKLARRSRRSSLPTPMPAGKEAEFEI